MLHFRESLQQAPVLANFTERRCSSRDAFSWWQITVQHVSDFSTWLCAEADFFTSSVACGWEYGILRGALANALHKTFVINTNTSGFGAPSPFSNCLMGSVPESVPIVSPSFSLHDETQPHHQQPLILRDLILQLDKHPHQRQFFWFPSGINPRDLWERHFPQLNCISFRCIVHEAKGQGVFSNCPKSLNGVFSLWSLAPPDLPAWPTAPSTIHPLWAVSKAAGGSIRMPTTSFADASEDESFVSLWSKERNVRRDCFAPKWNPRRRIVTTNIPWEDVFQSWDHIHSHVHLSSKKHIQKLHGIRMSTSSVSKSGTWIYALWNFFDSRVYVGQTGARQFPRSFGKRGSEHVRLALDALRLPGPGVNLPSQVYQWISRLGVENFVITPLEHVTPAQANAKEKWWMLRWGLGGLFNRDLRSVANEKWLFLTNRKIWDTDIGARGGSMLSVAQTILKNPKPLSTYDFNPTLLLAVVFATEKYLSASQHRKLFDKVYQLFLVHHKVFLPYRIPVKIPLLTPSLKIRLSSAIHEVTDRHVSGRPTSARI